MSCYFRVIIIGTVGHHSQVLLQSITILESGDVVSLTSEGQRVKCLMKQVLNTLFPLCRFNGDNVNDRRLPECRQQPQAFFNEIWNHIFAKSSFW